MTFYENSVFKMMSLRRPLDGLTIDPVQDGLGGNVIEVALGGVALDVAAPSVAVNKAVAGLQILTRTELNKSAIGKINDHITKKRPASVEDLENIQIDLDGSGPKALRNLASSEEFRKSYAKITDSWLAARLSANDQELTDHHEELLRVAHVAFLLVNATESLRPKGRVQQLLKAQVVLPRKWLAEVTDWKSLSASYGRRVTATSVPKLSSRGQRISAAKIRFRTQSAQISQTESIRAKLARAYAEWVTKNGGHEQPLTAAFYTDLMNSLSVEEKSVFNIRARNRPGPFGDLLDLFDIEELIRTANDACAAIKIWEDEEEDDYPTPGNIPASAGHPAIRNIGFGDLIVAIERLIGYQAAEIAHVENVLPGEEKLRKHDRRITTEDMSDTETITNTESERDLQSTNRFELQSNSQKTVNEDFSITAGVNTSGRYGLTQVDTSLEAGFQRSQSEATSSSVTTAQEIVSRAVERTSEQVRERRRLTVTEQIRELNLHSLKNSSVENGAPVPISGVYLWVEKLHQVQLRHYGTRLLIEFHVPEPALTLLDKNTGKKLPRKPAAFKLAPNDVTSANYLCLASRYGAEDVQPPPPLNVTIGWSWAGTPDESQGFHGQETKADRITIPAGYRPIFGRGVISSMPPPSQYSSQTKVSVAVGGRRIGRATDTNHQAFVFSVTPVVEWPQGIPVSLHASEIWDKTVFVQLGLHCERTERSYTAWQISTWERLREGHSVIVRNYERTIAAINLEEDALLFRQDDRLADQNREVEKEELKKWAIKIASDRPGRATPYDYNAVLRVGDHLEISPSEADFQAPVVRFFEEAFEWRQMTYFLYPYYWARRDTWTLRRHITHSDKTHEAFLRSGAARVIVPVTPGYEERICAYLASSPTLSELDRINSLPVPDKDSALWAEILVNKREGLALGSGTLTVQKGSTSIRINTDSLWEGSSRDIGREIFLDGDRYEIKWIDPTNSRHLGLDRAFEGKDNSEARYATGSVAYGPPWITKVPTSLTILYERRGDLGGLASG